MRNQERIRPDLFGLLLALLALALVTSTQASERELFDINGECFEKLDDGSLPPIPCPEGSTHPLTIAQVQESINQLDEFDKSTLAAQAKIAAREYVQVLDQLNLKTSKSANQESTRLERYRRDKAINGSDEMRAYRSNYSVEVLKKAARIRGDRYVAKLTFANDQNFPTKYSRGGGYYRRASGATERMDDTFAAQWDDIILEQVVGANYSEFSPKVESVSGEYVNIELVVTDSVQLQSILEGKNIYFIHHTGSPDNFLKEEIRPAI